MLPKFRLFAGPNGSGKTLLFDYLKTKGYIHTEIYVNADRIERDIKAQKKFNFNAYRVQVSDKEFKEHIKTSGLYEKVKDKNFINKLSISKGVLHIYFKENDISSYHASFIASYLVLKLLETKQSFCFETVMSHRSKIDLLSLAKKEGYKTYLYFVYTNDVKLNVARVKLRAESGLHDVDRKKIEDRYKRSIKLLPLALSATEEAYVFDNTNSLTIVAEKHKNVITPNEILPSNIKLK